MLRDERFQFEVLLDRNSQDAPCAWGFRSRQGRGWSPGLEWRLAFSFDNFGSEPRRTSAMDWVRRVVGIAARAGGVVDDEATL
jgi:hypothetical protein